MPEQGGMLPESPITDTLTVIVAEKIDEWLTQFEEDAGNEVQEMVMELLEQDMRGETGQR